MIQFILNEQNVTAQQPEGSTVLDYVRYFKRLHGTKIGCREGDCGACTILVGNFEQDKLVYRSMTSCLMPLGNANGKHIVTVEGINMKNLSPVQQAMVDTNGAQCGFCTLGFIMSFTGFVIDGKSRSYEDAITAIDGNICRCTGYKSIERSARIISDRLRDKPARDLMPWLVDNGFLPGYFTGIEERLLAMRNSSREAGNNKEALKIGGGTDLVVQRPHVVKKSPVELLFDDDSLHQIKTDGDQCSVGASVTVSEFVESSIVQNAFPSIGKLKKLVSSTPIRNMATLAGNLVNASPIGDMTIFFLALDASVVLNQEGKKRVLPLRNFYKGYKQIDKEPGEVIESITFRLPGDHFFNFEKVSRRTHLDIASVNAACLLNVQDSLVKMVHLSAGGVAPFPKYLQNTCNYLTGKDINHGTLTEAFGIMNGEVSPISDARGTATYKRLLLRQLFVSHFVQRGLVNGDIKKLLLNES